jgi:DNA-binding transcriptional LysR family regulator
MFDDPIYAIATEDLVALAAAEVGILPKTALPMPLKKDLRAAPIANPALSRTVAILALNGQSLSPAGRALTDAIRKMSQTANMDWGALRTCTQSR